MGRPKKPDSAPGKVVQIAPDMAETGNDPQETVPAAFPAPPTTPNPLPIPKESPGGRVNPFFQRIAAVPKVEWGVRAFIYVYCIEPICNLKMGGENKYLVKLSEPLLDEQPLMIDYGSGKYRLQFVMRKPDGVAPDKTDIVEIEIYNPKFPPKIPRSVWMNDPRNERWAALLPKEEPPAAPTGLGTVTEAFRTFTDIQRSIRDEMPPPPPPAPPAPQVDPMNNALQMVQTIMAMKADNPMVEIMKEQLRATNDLAEKAREREAALEKELRDSLRAALTRPEEKKGVGTLKEVLGEIKEFMPAIKELFPNAGEAIQQIRGGRTSGWDILREVANPLMNTLGSIAIAMATKPQAGAPPAYPSFSPNPGIAAPAANGTPAAVPAPAQQQQLTTEQRILMLLQQPIVLNAFRNYFEGACKVPPTNTGGDFAEWLSDGVGEQPLKDARGLGRDRIMEIFKHHPAWPMLAAMETQLVEFVDQILAWQPGTEDADETEEENEGVDLREM